MKQRRELLATADDVLRARAPSAVIIDTRTDDEYTAKWVRAARGGAIPDPFISNGPITSTPMVFSSPPTN